MCSSPRNFFFPGGKIETLFFPKFFYQNYYAILLYGNYCKLFYILICKTFMFIFFIKQMSGSQYMLRGYQSTTLICFFISFGFDWINIIFMKIYHGEGCKGLGFPLKILVLDFEDDWPQLHFSVSNWKKDTQLYENEKNTKSYFLKVHIGTHFQFLLVFS